MNHKLFLGARKADELIFMGRGYNPSLPANEPALDIFGKKLPQTWGEYYDALDKLDGEGFENWPFWFMADTYFQAIWIQPNLAGSEKNLIVAAERRAAIEREEKRILEEPD